MTVATSTERAFNLASQNLMIKNAKLIPTKVRSMMNFFRSTYPQAINKNSETQSQLDK